MGSEKRAGGSFSVIVLNHGTADQKFWDSKRWVSDVTKAFFYPTKTGRAIYAHLVRVTEQMELIGPIVLVENHDLDSERVTRGAPMTTIGLPKE